MLVRLNLIMNIKEANMGGLIEEKRKLFETMTKTEIADYLDNWEFRIEMIDCWTSVQYEIMGIIKEFRKEYGIN